jgi:type IV pilus assembly protein PilB
MPDTNYLEKIRSYLAQQELVDPAVLDGAVNKAEKSKRDLEDVLVEEKIFSSADFAAIKGKIFNLPVADLSDLEISRATLSLLPQKVAENYQAVIFQSQNNQVKVGLVNPGNFLAHEAVDFLAKGNHWQTQYFVISLDDFRRQLQQYGNSKVELTSALELAEEKFAAKDQAAVETAPTEQFDERIKSAPVAKIVSVIIRNAVDGKASDIHIEPGRGESRVRYRIDGVLHTSLSLPSYLHNSVVSRIKVMANLRLDETRIPQDGRIRSQMDGHDVDLRVSVLPMLNSKVVIRVLDTASACRLWAAGIFAPYRSFLNAISPSLSGSSC